jgi:hypothetical protein
MTKRERAQVVELLRCAADNAVMGDRASALGDAARALDSCVLPFLGKHGLRDGHWSELLRGRGPVNDAEQYIADDVRLICGTGYEFCLLEAAARVEEGTWP